MVGIMGAIVVGVGVLAGVLAGVGVAVGMAALRERQDVSQ